MGNFLSLCSLGFLGVLYATCPEADTFDAKREVRKVFRDGVTVTVGITFHNVFAKGIGTVASAVVGNRKLRSSFFHCWFGGGKIGSAHLRQQIHGVEGRLVSFVFCRNFRLTKYS